jgi:hypothetical protein
MGRAQGYAHTLDMGDDETLSNLPDVRMPDAVQVSVGDSHSCAVMADRSLRCWGMASTGQLGNGDFYNDIGDDEHPDVTGALVSLGTQAVQVSCGAYHTCAVTTVRERRGRGEGGVDCAT